MEIALDEKEYRSLLEMMEIADWVLHAYRLDEPVETESYRQLAQKIYAAAKNYKSEDLVHYDLASQQFFPSEKLEESDAVLDRIAEFENACFWDELIHRLVERDLIDSLGEEAVTKLDPTERSQRGEVFEKKYEKTFQESGLDHLVIAEKRAKTPQ